MTIQQTPEKIQKTLTPSIPHTITEGSTTIYSTISTFFNTSQQFNRSISVLILHTYITHYIPSHPKSNKQNQQNHQKQFLNFFEAMSATGIRSLRYLQEIPFFSNPSPTNPFTFTINDLSPTAISQINSNISLNNINTDSITVTNLDAIDLMLDPINKGKFSIIDIDPFGTPSQFIYPALRAIEDKGLLCVTATDMMNLCSKQADVVYRNYSAKPSRGHCSKEIALRLVMGDIVRTAAKMSKVVKPMFTSYCGFYIKMFFVVEMDKKKSLEMEKMNQWLWECSTCSNFYFNSNGNSNSNSNSNSKSNSNSMDGNRCGFCGGVLSLSGPVWAGDLYDKEFITYVENDNNEELFSNYFISPTLNDIKKFMVGVGSESHIPFYYSYRLLGKMFPMNLPPMVKVFGALEKLGFETSKTHFGPDYMKTDADVKIVYEICANYLFCLRSKGKIGEEEIEMVKKFCDEYGLELREDKYCFDKDGGVVERMKKISFLTINLKGGPKKAVGKTEKIVGCK